MRGLQDAWSDQFSQPTEKELRALLQKPGSTLFDRTIRLFDGLSGVRREMVWYGQPWRWTVTYRTKLSEEPLAVLVPNPEDLQLAMPMDQDFAESLVERKPKKTVHDGLDMVRAPFDSRWGVWSLIAAGIVDELHQIAELNLERLSLAAGCLAMSI